MRRQGERPELIRWQLCGMISPLPSWRSVYQHVEAARAGRGRSSSAHAIAEGGRRTDELPTPRTPRCSVALHTARTDGRPLGQRAALGPQYSEEWRQLRADRCADGGIRSRTSSTQVERPSGLLVGSAIRNLLWSGFETHPTWAPSLDAAVGIGTIPLPVNHLIRF